MNKEKLEKCKDATGPSEFLSPNNFRNEMLEWKLRCKSLEKVLETILNHTSFDANGVGIIEGLSKEERGYINELYVHIDKIPLSPDILKSINKMTLSELKTLRKNINELINKRSS